MKKRAAGRRACAIVGPSGGQGDQSSHWANQNQDCGIEQAFLRNKSACVRQPTIRSAIRHCRIVLSCIMEAKIYPRYSTALFLSRTATEESGSARQNVALVASSNLILKSALAS